MDVVFAEWRYDCTKPHWWPELPWEYHREDRAKRRDVPRVKPFYPSNNIYLSNGRWNRNAFWWTLSKDDLLVDRFESHLRITWWWKSFSNQFDRAFNIGPTTYDKERRLTRTQEGVSLIPYRVKRPLVFHRKLHRPERLDRPDSFDECSPHGHLVDQSNDRRGQLENGTHRWWSLVPWLPTRDEFAQSINTEWLSCAGQTLVIVCRTFTLPDRWSILALVRKNSTEVRLVCWESTIAVSLQRMALVRLILRWNFDSSSSKENNTHWDYLQ